MDAKFYSNQALNFDYSKYEQKIKNITSVKLEHITDLHTPEQKIGSLASIEPVLSYVEKIAQLLKETSEEV